MSTLGPVACVNVSKDKQLGRRGNLAARARHLRDLRRSTRRSRLRPIRARRGLGSTNEEAGQAERDLCPQSEPKVLGKAQSVGSGAWPFQTGQALLVGK